MLEGLPDGIGRRPSRPGQAGRSAGLGAAAVLLLAGLAPSAGAQEPVGGVLEARVTADLTGQSGVVSVQADYRLWLPEGAREVPVSVLRAASTRIRAIRARSESGELELLLPESPSVRLQGVIRVPWDVTGDPADSGGRARRGSPLALTVEYQVAGAVSERGEEVRLVVPVLAVEWPPTDPLPATFQAELLVPGDMVVYESFPSEMAEVAAEGARRRYRAELPVLPSYVSLRARRGSAPLLTVSRAADALVLATLLILGAAGWRYLTRRA